tara:strand:+ start:203 stop:508 length:306 start_codon:yes stop_codon:yes gene_type:complete
MFITNSKHKDFKIINSKNNNKFILRLFNFEFFNKNHHSKKDIDSNKIFVLDCEFNSIKDIYSTIKVNGINNLKNYLYNDWYFKKHKKRIYNNKSLLLKEGI